MDFIHIEHELDHIGLFDFAAGRPAITDGYRTTMKVLAESGDPLKAR